MFSTPSFPFISKGLFQCPREKLKAFFVSNLFESSPLFSCDQATVGKARKPKTILSGFLR